MSEWQPIETAPKDGTWIVLEGEFAGGDTSCATIGRWEPTSFKIGSQWILYEWRVCDRNAFGDGQEPVPAKDVWNFFSAGRVHAWMPLA